MLIHFNRAYAEKMRTAYQSHLIQTSESTASSKTVTARIAHQKQAGYKKKDI